MNARSDEAQALRDAANRLASQQEQERRRLGAELHDQLGQDMTAIATRLRLAERRTQDPQLRDDLRAIGTFCRERARPAGRQFTAAVKWWPVRSARTRSARW